MRAACAASILAGALAAAAPAAAEPAEPPLTHVRALDACAGKVVAAGMLRSPTFRALVEELGRSNVIVFVYTTPYLSPHVSGGLSFVGASPSWRYLKVALRRDQPFHQMIWILAHELHHATEVARVLDARTQAAFNTLYTHIGTNGALPDTYETEAACSAGLQVRQELGGGGD